MTRIRRARLIRLLFTLINVIAALTSVGVGATLLLLREPPAPRPAPRPVVLPAGLPEEFALELPDLPGRSSQPLPEPVRPTAYEDLRILLDAPADFEARYRVIFASLERKPAERHCIIQRQGGEQLVLIPNERVGTWLLLAIEPEPTSPRSVRLRFRDLRRGEEIITVLAPDL